MNESSEFTYDTWLFPVLGDVKDELVKRYDVFGDQRFLNDDRWTLLLAKGLGDLAMAVSEGLPSMELYKEVIQVIAMAVTWAEGLAYRVGVSEQLVLGSEFNE